MNILIVTDSYPPEIRSASHLMQELAEELHERGHRISVLTTLPAYNLHPSSTKRTFEERSVENGVEVIRAKTYLPIHKVNFILRGVAQLVLPWFLLRTLRKYAGSPYDAVIVYSPPLPLCFVGARVGKRNGGKFILNVQDIFPQNAIDLGIMRNGAVVKGFEWLEKKAYRDADLVVVHSSGNRNFLIDRGKALPGKVRTIHNWIDVSPFRDVRNVTSFRKDFGLEGKFVFLFAGVIGPSQGLDMLLEVAKGTSHLDDIAFLLVGDGSEKTRLVKIAALDRIRNIHFRPFVPKEAYPSLVKDIDVGLVCISSKNKTPVVPGKMLGYMAAARPVLAFLNKESDGHTIIRDARCGYSSVSDDLARMRELVIRMYAEKETLSDLGRSGREYVMDHFEIGKCIDEIEKLMRDEVPG